MGKDRSIVASKDIKKGQAVAKLYKTHNYTDALTEGEIIEMKGEILMLHTKTRDCSGTEDYFEFYDMLVNKFQDLINECEKIGQIKLLNTITEDGFVEIEDKA